MNARYAINRIFPIWWISHMGLFHYSRWTYPETKQKEWLVILKKLQTDTFMYVIPTYDRYSMWRVTHLIILKWRVTHLSTYFVGCTGTGYSRLGLDTYIMCESPRSGLIHRNREPGGRLTRPPTRRMMCEPNRKSLRQ